LDQNKIKLRTKEFAKRIIELCRKLPENYEGKLIRGQIFRSATSLAANYRAACRARSASEFIAKLGIVEEEADETLFWLELIEELKIMPKSNLKHLMQENNEIIAIIVSSIKTARKNKSEI
jgi:four helix bundle protein